MSNLVDAKLSRRKFVAATGAAAALGLASTSACSSSDNSQETKTNKENAEAPKVLDDPFKGAQVCYATCPPECQHHQLKAYVIDGKIQKIVAGEKNESKPCMRGLSRKEWVHSPDRLAMPLLRDGEKGENKWKEISWDEALDLIVEKLKDAIATGGNQSILNDSHAGNFNALAGAVGPAFFSRIGGTSSLTGSLCCAAVGEAMIKMWGQRFLDLRNFISDSDYIIAWGNNPAVTMHGYFDRFEEAMKKGGKLITIDPLFNETASKASKWIPIKPATDVALSLGMLKHIVDNNLHDEKFLKERSTAPCLIDSEGKTVLVDEADELSYAVYDSKSQSIQRHDAEGIDPLLSVKDTELANSYTTVFDLTVKECEPWTPEAVETETQVPADDVIEIAEGYAKAKNAMIVQNMGGFMRNSQGTYAVASQLNLAIFTGQVGRPGAGVCDAGGAAQLQKLAPMWENEKHNLPVFPRVKFGEYIRDDKPNEIKVFFSHRESPMTQFPNTQLVKDALKKIPFVVVIDSLMTSTALYADLVLPNKVVFETEDVLLNSRSHYLQISEAGVQAPGEAQSDFWIFKELAKRMGFGDEFAGEEKDYIAKGLEGIGVSYDELKEQKAIDLVPDDFIPYENGVFPTKSTKAELYQAQWLKHEGYTAVPTYKKAAETAGGSSKLDEKYPLALVQRKNQFNVHSTFTNLKPVNDLFRDEPVMIINHKDAEPRNIKSGDKILAFNDRGEHRAIAEVSDYILPGVVSCENGWWEQNGGSSSYLTNDTPGTLATEHSCNETLVEIKLEGDK